LPKHINKEKIEYKIEMTGRQGGRGKQLLDDLREGEGTGN